MEKSLSYKDVYLVPQYSELVSRSQADISVQFLGKKFKAPWIPANMESVINLDIARWLSQNGYFYIYHRFGDNEKFVCLANKESWPTISISVGVKEEDKKFINWISRNNLNVDVICIDVAHGDSILVKEMIEFIKRTRFESCKAMYCRGFTSILLNYQPYIIAGNVCTLEGALRLQAWGANAVKVGIAGGHACSTKNMTGFHVPMFSCVKNVSSAINYQTVFYRDGVRACDSNKTEKLQIPIIADGGIRENGDIPKALVAGATMVMAGGLFAACIDAPGEDVHKNAKTYAGTNIYNPPETILGPVTHKRYYGSASAKQKGNHTHVEGFEIEIPTNNLTYSEKYRELTESLQSAVSYAGGNNLEALKKVEYIRV